MKPLCYAASMYCDGYGLHRWWEHSYHQSLHGAYLLVCNNIELYRLQNNFEPHVVCVVDDFGNLVRKS